MSSPAVTRKRSRPQLDDHDELSPEKDSRTTPLTSTKKRKLHSDGSTPKTGTVLSGIGRSFGKLIGWSGQEETVGNDEEVDELAGGGIGEWQNNTWDFPDGEYDMESRSLGRESRIASEHTSAHSTPMRRPTPVKSTKAHKTAGSNNQVAEATEEDIWEVPLEQDSSRRSSRSGMSVERRKAILPPIDQIDTINSSPQRGRRKVSQILKKDKKLSKQAARERLTAAHDDEEDEEEEEDDHTATPTKKGKNSHMRNENTTETVLTSIVASNGRKRGRPKKVPIDLANTTQQLPKGILTPSKTKTVRPRKSVAFQDVTGLDLGFKDLPAAAKTNESKQTHNLAQEVVKMTVIDAHEFNLEEPDSSEDVIAQVKGADSIMLEEDEEEEAETDEDEADEEVCEICSRPDWTKKNPILLCDGCDKGFHKKCYNIPRLPAKSEDWYCRDCQPDPEGDITFAELGNVVDTESRSKLPDIEGVQHHLQNLQRHILDRLMGHKRIKLRGHDDELQKVSQLVEQTVLAGEGNSMLVIGARGCGKTSLVESVISELSVDHKNNFHVVRLNGFIQTDDKLALKEIWRQLGREIEVEDDLTGKASNYADTLASLLALLSHPSELSESQPEEIAKSVVFVLDEFDLFTTHSRQTLLYNLFDIAQARKAPIIVLGLTTRVDVVESLEKRVKSRFSHRYVHLTLPQSLPAFWEICKGGLLVDIEETSVENINLSRPGQDEFDSFWSTMVENLYKDTIFKHWLASHFYRTKSVPAFFTSCIFPIATLGSNNFPLTGKLFMSNALTLSPPDSKLQILRGLSELELALLIAAARLDVILDTDTCNFAMAYDEYSSLTSRHKIQTSSTGVAALGANAKVWGREVALGSWERLANYELLVPAAIGGGSGRDFGVGGRMWKIDVALEEITGSIDGLSGVMSKWCREI